MGEGCGMGQGVASSLRYGKGAQGTGINIYMTLRESWGEGAGGNNNFAGTTLAHTRPHVARKTWTILL